MTKEQPGGPFESCAPSCLDAHRIGVNGVRTTGCTCGKRYEAPPQEVPAHGADHEIAVALNGYHDIPVHIHRMRPAE